MRLVARFNLTNPELPKDYRPAFVSFFKNVLTNFNKELAKLYYNNSDPIMKSFTFSLLLNKPSFTEDKIKLENKMITLLLSTYDLKDGLIFHSAILNSKKTLFSLPNKNSMHIIDLKIPQVPEITESEISIKMVSPMIIRDHDKKTNKDTYLDYTNKEFCEKIKNIVLWQITDSKLDQNLVNDFSITPIDPKRTVVTAFNYNLNANLGVYKLKGHPDLLKFLYLSGIGSRRNQGFGTFNLI